MPGFYQQINSDKWIDQSRVRVQATADPSRDKNLILFHFPPEGETKTLELSPNTNNIQK